MKKLKYFLIEMRPKQWVKNLFLFPALIFSKSFENVDRLERVLLGFIMFCAASGCVYIINDIIDRDKDKLHPRKSKRPIASGALKVPEALIFAITVLTLVVVGAYFLSVSFLIVLGIYVLVVLFYSLGLKHMPIIDIMAIAAGFVLRALAGAVVINVEPSPWLMLCTTVLCLFLAANKRRSELQIMKEDAKAYKASLGAYTPEFLNQVITICLSLSIVLYALYSYFTNIPLMMATTVFVIYGLLRYQLIANAEKTADNVEIIVLKDKPLLINVGLYALSAILIVWKFY